MTTANTPGMTRRSWLQRSALVSVATLLGGCLPSASKPIAFKGIDITGANYGRDFQLSDMFGAPRTLADYRGKVVMIFFGFVQCPDVCPTTLFRAREVVEQLGPDAERLQVLFITVDPERDRPEVLRDYMAAFHPSFVGLVGTEEQTRAAAQEFKVFYQKVPTGSSYTMDHTAFNYLIDPQGRIRVVLRHEQAIEDYVADIQSLLREAQG